MWNEKGKIKEVKRGTQNIGWLQGERGTRGE